MNVTPALRSRFFDTGYPPVDTALGELARDTAEALFSVPQLSIVQFVSVDTLPLRVGLDHEPKMLILGRIQYDSDPTTPAPNHGVAADFTWDARTSTALVYAIHAFAASGQRMRFTFLVVG